MCLKLASRFKAFERQEQRHNHLKLVFTGGYQGYEAVKLRDLDNQIPFVTYLANPFS